MSDQLWYIEPPTHAANQMSHTPACGFTATERSASAERFASHDLGDGLDLIHRVDSHEPRHDLLVCSKIGSYDICVRPSKRDHF